jgi:hypothetical protein
VAGVVSSSVLPRTSCLCLTYGSVSISDYVTSNDMIDEY